MLRTSAGAFCMPATCSATEVLTHTKQHVIQEGFRLWQNVRHHGCLLSFQFYDYLLGGKLWKATKLATDSID